MNSRDFRTVERLIFSFSIFLMISFAGYCQSDLESPDSLMNIIKNHPKNDTRKVDLLCDWLTSRSLNVDDEFKQNLDKALKISKSLDYKYGLAKSYFLHGWYYSVKSKPKKSIEYNYKAISLFEELGDTVSILRTYSNLSAVYNKQNDIEGALRLNLKTIELSKNMPNDTKKAGFYFYTGYTYDKMEDFENARVYFLKAKEISEDCGFELGVSIANGSLGQNYIRLKQYDKALPLLQEVLEYQLKSNQSRAIAGAYESLGQCYFEMKQYRNAISHLSQASSMYENYGHKEHLEYIFAMMADSYENLGQPEQAIEYLKKSAKIVSELQLEEQTKVVEELKAKYRTNELNQEKRLAQSNEKVAKEKEKTSRYTSYGLAIASIVMIGFLFYIARQLRTIRKQKQELNEAYRQLEESKKHELAASNLKAIRSQMNPHLVFNSINSIQALVLDKDVEKSYDYIEKFSSLFRKTLNYSEMNSIDLEKEIEFLTIYLELESLRMKEEFTFSITKSTEEEISIPTLLIQPFIENAIHHGLLHKEGAKRLTVDFSLEDGVAKCVIQDNGIGREMSREINARQRKAASFSLSAINRRLSLLGEQVGEEFEYTFEDLVDDEGNAMGTRVTVSFPHTFNY